MDLKKLTGKHYFSCDNNKKNIPICQFNYDPHIFFSDPRKVARPSGVEKTDSWLALLFDWQLLC